MDRKKAEKAKLKLLKKKQKKGATTKAMEDWIMDVPMPWPPSFTGEARSATPLSNPNVSAIVKAPSQKKGAE